MYCADCGAKLYNDSQRAYAQKDGYKPDPLTGYYGSDHYECKNYKLVSVRETAICTSHRVNTNALIKLLLETIRLVSEYAITNKEEFAEKVRAVSLSQHKQSVKEQKKQLVKSEKRYDELDELIKKLYESYATGKLSEKHFEHLSAGYEQEQENLENEIYELKQSLETYEEETDNVNQFIELAKKYTDKESIRLTDDELHEDLYAERSSIIRKLKAYKQQQEQTYPKPKHKERDGELEL